MFGRLRRFAKLIQARQTEAQVRDLIAEHDFENVCNAVKSLLEHCKSKIKFPEVFDISPAQSADRSVSAAEAAPAEVHVVHYIYQGPQHRCSCNEIQGH